MKGGLTGLEGRDFDSVIAELYTHAQPAYIKDGDLRFVAANAAYCALVKCDEKTLLGQQMSDVVSDTVSADLDVKERRALVFGRQYSAALTLPGCKEHLRASVRQLIDANGFKFVLVVFGSKQTLRFEGWKPSDQHDVSEPKSNTGGSCLQRKDSHSAQSADCFASDAAERWQHGLQEHENAFVLWDPGYRIVGCNAAFKKRFPLVTDWSAGRSLSDIVSEIAATGLVPQAAADRRAWVDTMVAQHKVGIERDSSLHCMQASWTLWRNHTTSNGDRACIGTDVTTLVAQQKEMENPKRTSPDYLANLSHEFRIPLIGIVGMAQMLKQSGLQKNQQKLADVIVQSGRSLLDILTDVMDYARLASGSLILSQAAFSPQSIVDDVSGLLAAGLVERDLDLVVKYADNIPQTLVGDVVRIRQILVNLVSNAIKNTDVGHVEIDVCCNHIDTQNAHIEFSVSDTGCGMDGSKKQRICRNFDATDDETATTADGAGLGLALCARLTRLMGGRIGLESQVGKGTRVWFALQLPVGRQAAGHASDMRSDRTRILAVCADDKPCEIVRNKVAALPFDSCIAIGAEEGLKVIRAARQLDLPIDLVLVSCQDDISVALSIVRSIRSDVHLQNPAIILMEPVENCLTHEQRHGLKIDAFVSAGCSPRALHNTIVSVLETSNRNNWPQAMRPTDPGSVEAPGDVDAGKSVPSHHPVLAADASSGREVVGGTARLDVLVAEDNSVNQIVFTQLLQQMGYSCHVVADGEEAVAAWQQLRPNVILMDVTMPLLNGFQAARIIRQAEVAGGMRTPIIGVVTHAFSKDEEKCIQAGMDDYLVKPISRDKLGRILSTWSRTRQQIQQHP